MKWQNEGWHHFSSFCDFQSINFDVKGNSNEFDHNHSLLGGTPAQEGKTQIPKIGVFGTKNSEFLASKAPKFLKNEGL